MFPNFAHEKEMRATKEMWHFPLFRVMVHTCSQGILPLRHNQPPVMSIYCNTRTNMKHPHPYPAILTLRCSGSRSRLRAAFYPDGSCICISHTAPARFSSGSENRVLLILQNAAVSSNPPDEECGGAVRATYAPGGRPGGSNPFFCHAVKKRPNRAVPARG